MANSGSFKKGHKTWNKGLHISLSPKSQWKKGDTAMQKHPQWKGGIQKPKKDCVHINIDVGTRIRRPRFIYEKADGKIPSGHIIFHKDGNKLNDNISNLIAISRAELMERNNPNLVQK